MSRRMLVLGTALILFSAPEVHAARCNLSGKEVFYAISLCLSTGCEIAHQQISILGQKVLHHLEGKNVGRVYTIGMEIEATKDPSQRDSESLQTPVLGARYIVLLRATVTDSGLTLEDQELLYTNSQTHPRNAVRTTTRFTFNGCESCSFQYRFVAINDDGNNESVDGTPVYCRILNSK